MSYWPFRQCVIKYSSCSFWLQGFLYASLQDIFYLRVGLFSASFTYIVSFVEGGKISWTSPNKPVSKHLISSWLFYTILLHSSVGFQGACRIPKAAQLWKLIKYKLLEIKNKKTCLSENVTFNLWSSEFSRIV